MSPPNCDVCGYTPKFRGLRYGQCKTCGVGVHLACGGIGEPNDGKEHDITFECWACQAVGKRFQVEAFTSSGKRVKLKQERRPTRCELCSVSTGVHSMHPLFDNHGMQGRQLHIRDGNKPRLAWCHTACAQLINANDALVYGCRKDGWYDGADEDDWDGRSENSDLGRDKTVHVGTIHHFAYCLKQNGRHNAWTRRIRDLQELKCTECGTNDRGSFRIPMQCAAGTDRESEELKQFHSSEYCTQPLHVGCARWSKRGAKNSAKKVYYFAGDDEMEPVAHVYCILHATQVANGLAKKKRKIRGESSIAVPRKSSSTSVPRRGSMPTHRKRAQSPSSTGSQRRMKAAPVVGRGFATLPMPSLARDPSNRAANGNAVSGGKNGNASRAELSAQAIPRRASQREAQMLDPDDAVALKKPKRGALLNRGLRTAEQTAQITRAKTTEDRIEEVLKDVLDEYPTYGDKDKRSEYLKMKKNKWRRQLASEVNKDEFKKKIWDPVLDKCNQERKRRKNSDVVIENEPIRQIETIAGELTDDAAATVSQQRTDEKSDSASGNNSLANKGTGNIQSQAVSVDAAVNRSRNANEQNHQAPKRDWSKLFVGPTYDNNAFNFDEWDSFEVIFDGENRS